MICAIVENDVITNVIDAEPGFLGSILLPPGASIGWVRVDGVWGPPAPPAPEVPKSVTMRQARLALLGVGLLDDVDAAIAGIPDEAQRRAVQIEWEFSSAVDRDRPFVAMLGSALGLNSAALDQLFITASTL